jgi:hypothetical protein
MNAGEPRGSEYPGTSIDGFDASRSMVGDQSGKRLMDHLHTLTAEMEESERELLAKRTER